MSVIPGYIYTDNNFWYEYEDYWIYSAPQKSEEWLKVRKGRISGSTVAENIGCSEYSTQEEALMYTCGLKKKEFSDFALNAMSHGVKYEPVARDWYEKNYLKNNNMFVIEIGFLIPKRNLHLGFSPDGIIFSCENDKTPIGIIEIKCPQKMYYGLYDKKNDMSHIKVEHYQQMQLGMAVTKTKFCIYIVFSVNDGNVYTEYVNFNEEYWNNMNKNINYVIENFISKNINLNEFIKPERK